MPSPSIIAHPSESTEASAPTSSIVLHSFFDQYASQRDPYHVPLEQEVLKMLLLAQGATDDDASLLEYQRINNQLWQDILNRREDHELPSMGVRDTYVSSA